MLAAPVDMLKIDIEGAEAVSLAACTRLDAVSQIMVEYRPFADTPYALHELLTKVAKSALCL